MKRDEWVTRALCDEAVVAEFLMRLKHPTAALALAWGSRRERSAVKKDRDSKMKTRCSPTTPLSWTCAAASEDSTRPSDLSSSARSKGTYTNDSIACNWANKRSKRKKSFTEHQEEETLLLKEGTHLKTELETLHVTLKKQRVKSDNLNRLKIDLHQQEAFGVAPKPYYAEGLNVRQANGANCSGTDYVQASIDINMHKDHVVTATAIKAEKSFFLPDLNMPFEDDSTFDSLTVSVDTRLCQSHQSDDFGTLKSEVQER